MKVTFLSASLDLSGGSRIISTYAKMLADRGHQVSVVAVAPRPVPLRRRLRVFLSTGQWRSSGATPSHYDGLGLDIRMVKDRIRESDVPDADVVIATWWETAEWANQFPHRKGTKVYFVQGHEVFDFLPIERAAATYRMPFFKIVVSGWLQRIMASVYGDTSSVLVPNSVDHVAFDAPARDKQPVPTLGFMYAPGSIKGSELMLEVAARLRRRLPQLRVVSFGTYLPVGDSRFADIEFQHRPTHEQLRAAYATCDVWMCASRSEGFGLPAMEAMACRTPVVSTRVGWPEDAIEDGVNGYLVPIDNVDALAQAVEKVLTLPAGQWRDMSSRAYGTSRAYSWSRSKDLFEAALKQAVQADRKSVG